MLFCSACCVILWLIDIVMVFCDCFSMFFMVSVIVAAVSIMMFVWFGC